jgi:hypothetical protein
MEVKMKFKKGDNVWIKTKINIAVPGFNNRKHPYHINEKWCGENEVRSAGGTWFTNEDLKKLITFIIDKKHDEALKLLQTGD